MSMDSNLKCQKCSSNNLEIKREATYVYTYDISSSSSDRSIRRAEETPFMFDDRKKIKEKDFLHCKNCGTIYEFSVDDISDNVEFTIVQKAIRSDYQETPEFLG
ncbi:hypothetical protein [Clostridium folliculivorans]|uniref:Uncharacterized protein n=1 Tax=Clostridium folliculivorans TaxID=2886038 RepID=A0A9W5Y4W3_9CLOT|nr:hypothetical protein [Clostridium folliculivorans]GKU26711.1 hypothetical protein CFOLD11_35380 [Clostridium folliculivorans]GKU28857.1 hypothetical protein CFB3_09630 [Clostridium folliculivorans]